MTHLRIGQMVVCVDGDFRGVHPLDKTLCQFPARGRIYTIRGFLVRPDDGLGLLLEEIVNPADYYSDGYGEPAFFAYRFRPVKETNIEIFRKLVAPIDSDTVLV